MHSSDIPQDRGHDEEVGEAPFRDNFGGAAKATVSFGPPAFSQVAVFTHHLSVFTFR